VLIGANGGMKPRRMAEQNHDTSALFILLHICCEFVFLAKNYSGFQPNVCSGSIHALSLMLL
jgi:hypothetical protein